MKEFKITTHVKQQLRSKILLDGKNLVEIDINGLEGILRILSENTDVQAIEQFLFDIYRLKVLPVQENEDEIAEETVEAEQLDSATQEEHTSESDESEVEESAETQEEPPNPEEETTEESTDAEEVEEVADTDVAEDTTEVSNDVLEEKTEVETPVVSPTTEEGLEENHLNEYGVDLEDGVDKDEVLKLYSQLKTWKKVASYLGWSDSQLYKFRKSHGI